MKVSSISQMRSLDKRAIEEFGIKEELLMENAGHAVYYALQKEVEIREKRFLIFCGVGNNGGDGCVLARKIHADGGWVKVFILGNPKRFRGAARLNYEIITRLPIEVKQVSSIDELREDFLQSDFIVDAILGTGLSRDIEGLYREVIMMINDSGKPILSIDIPSGVQGDSGKIMGVAVKADFTVTFGLPKYGNMLLPGCELGGKLYVSHISFPPEIYTTDDLKVNINQPINFPAHLNEMKAVDSNGVIYLVGSSDSGVRTFLNLGKGSINLVTKSFFDHNLDKAENRINIVLDQGFSTGNSSNLNKKVLLESSADVDMVILGFGFAQNEDDKKLVLDLILEIDKSMIVSGDNLLAIHKNWDLLKEQKRQRVFLIGKKLFSEIFGPLEQEIETHKICVLQQAADRINSTIVFLDDLVLIGFPDGSVFINLSGTSGIDKKDIWEGLDGMIAFFYSLGLSLEDAIKQGVFVQGLAGDLFLETSTQEKVPHQDYCNTLSQAYRMVQSGISTDLVDRYSGAELV